METEHNLGKSIDKLKADASGILVCVSKMKGLKKHNEMVEASIEKRSQELDLKEKELERLSLEHDERVKRFEAEKDEAGDLKKQVEECTDELRLKRNDLTAKLDSSMRIQRDIELRNKHLEKVMAEVKRRCDEARNVQDRKRQMEDETDGKKNELALILDKIKEAGKKVVAVDEQLESRQRLLKNCSSELVSKEKELERVRESIKHSKSDFEQKQKMVQSLHNYLAAYGQEINTKSRELGEIQKMTEQQTGELRVVNDQLCLTKAYIQKLSEEIVIKEKRHMEIVETIQRRFSEIEEMAKVIKVAEAEASGLYVRSQRLRKEVDDKEKELCLLKNETESEEMKLVQLKRELEEEICKKKKDLECINQQNASEAEPVYEDAFMFHESAASLGVSRALKASPNPAELVVNLVQEYIREGSCLNEEDSLDIMVLFCDGLAKLQLPYESELQLKARAVATLWKEMITTEAPKSSVETLAFLLFIVAYGLKELINQAETVQLVSSIAQYEQAPTVFNSFGLKLEMIREFVKELINKRQYIPAVRFICFFKLNREFSPSHILKEEIINLRQYALGKRPVGSSQAKDKDGGRLRAILELVADHNLEVDLPGDLMAKLLIQREKPTPLPRCSSSNQQANSPNTVSVTRPSVNLLGPKPEIQNII